MGNRCRAVSLIGVARRRQQTAMAIVIAALILAVTAPSAWAGSSIRTVPACADNYLIFAPGEGTTAQFRTALLCLINAARTTQHLPALARSAQLEKVAQSQSNRFAATGSASHGSSLTDITKRFAKVGYHAAAYDEAFDVMDSGTTPYGFLAHMLDASSIPCSEIFDPRWRDVGIGANATEGVDTLALEFGRRTGQRQPSTSTRAATSCPHKIPKPIVGDTPPVAPGTALPIAGADSVTLALKCASAAACVFTGTLSLPDAHAKSTTPAPVTIPARRTMTLTFPFSAAQIRSELSAKNPNVRLSLTVTAPAQYTTTITGPLQQ